MHRIALVAADIEIFPGVAGEGRTGQPAPAGIALHRLLRAGFQPEQAGRQVGLAAHDQASPAAGEPALDAGHGLGGEVRGVGHEQRPAAVEPPLVELGLLDQMVLEIATSQQQARGVGREIGIFAFDPGARQAPGIGEGVGLATRAGFGGIGVAAAAAEQHDDVVEGLIGHGGDCARVVPADANGNGRGLPGRFCHLEGWRFAYWTTISTRRFCGSRTPSPVGTSGLDSPRPITVMEAAGTPSRTRASLTALARRSDSAML